MKKSIRNFNVVIKEWYKKKFHLLIISEVYRYYLLFYECNINNCINYCNNYAKNLVYTHIIEVFRNYLLISNLIDKNKLLNENKSKLFYNTARNTHQDL